MTSALRITNGHFIVYNKSSISMTLKEAERFLEEVRLSQELINSLDDLNHDIKDISSSHSFLSPF